MKLEELFNKYIELSNEIINVINQGKEEECADLIIERQGIVKEIASFNFPKDQIMELRDKFDIVSLDNRVKELIIQRKNELKEEMISLKKQKQANSIYGKQFENVYFINKKA